MNKLNIGIIPDGNRRFAKENKISFFESYKLGSKKFEELLEFCLKKYKKEIKSLVFYVMSLDNFLKRKKEEKTLIFKLLVEYINNYLKNEEAKKDINLKLIGEKKYYSKELKELDKKLGNLNGKNKLEVYLAFIYSGRKEIENIAKNYNKNKKFRFEELLYYPYNLDIVIRTGKEKRISDFLNYQISYAEFFFLDKYWPEFSIKDFEKILKEFKKRKRNFGK